MFFRPQYVRIQQRLEHTHKATAILDRRRLYPVVKVYGGLWKVRRQIVDDSFIREVKAACESHTSDGVCPVVQGFEDEWSSQSDSVKSKCPDYAVHHDGPKTGTSTFSSWLGEKLSHTNSRTSR